MNTQDIDDELFGPGAFGNGSTNPAVSKPAATAITQARKFEDDDILGDVFGGSSSTTSSNYVSPAVTNANPLFAPSSAPPKANPTSNPLFAQPKSNPLFAQPASKSNQQSNPLFSTASNNTATNPLFSTKAPAGAKMAPPVATSAISSRPPPPPSNVNPLFNGGGNNKNPSAFNPASKFDDFPALDGGGLMGDSNRMMDHKNLDFPVLDQSPVKKDVFGQPIQQNYYKPPVNNSSFPNSNNSSSVSRSTPQGSNLAEKAGNLFGALSTATSVANFVTTTATSVVKDHVLYTSGGAGLTDDGSTLKSSNNNDVEQFQDNAYQFFDNSCFSQTSGESAMMTKSISLLSGEEILSEYPQNNMSNPISRGPMSPGKQRPMKVMLPNVAASHMAFLVPKLYITNFRVFLQISGPRPSAAMTSSITTSISFLEWIDAVDYLSVPWGSIKDISPAEPDSEFHAGPMMMRGVVLETKDLSRMLRFEDISDGLSHEFMKFHSLFAYPPDFRKLFSFSYAGNADPGSRQTNVNKGGKIKVVEDFLAVEDPVAENYSEPPTGITTPLESSDKVVDNRPLFLQDGGDAINNDDGWGLYRPLEELARLGVNEQHGGSSASSDIPWKITNANRDYHLCETYPSILAVPRAMGDSELGEVAQYRKKKRIPALSWCGGSDIGYAAVFRSSQTTEGLFGNECKADEKMLKCMWMPRGMPMGQGLDQKFFVLDLRSSTAANLNKAGGGGYETYTFCKVEFCDIPNIHFVRGAFEKMCNGVRKIKSYVQTGTWFRDVADSQWLEALGLILCAAAKVTVELRRGRSVLVHCSDGWDRTAQNTTLVMLSLDSYYRTIRGFCMLIEKEFCSFGHRFRTRMANGEKATSEYSPIFWQWLDCVYQLVRHYPTEFEFNEDLLLFLAENVVTNKYGTFLGDNERERWMTMQCHQKTASIWTDIMREKSKYTNPTFKPKQKHLNIKFSQIQLAVWERFFFRRHPHNLILSKSDGSPVVSAT